MGGQIRLIDPFGAPEYFVNGVQHCLVCPELVRVSFYATEGNESIVKVKLLVPVTFCMTERLALQAFLKRANGLLLHH